MPRTFSFSTATTSSPTPTETAPPSESLISRVVFAPLLFISFLISLVIVDHDASTSVLGTSSSPSGKNGSTSSRSNEKKYYHSHQRKLARREVGDAFDMRNKVLVGLCIGMGIAIAGMAWFVNRVWEGWAKEQLVSVVRTVTSKIR